MAQKLPKMAQKLAPAKKNSRDISPVSPTFSISAQDMRQKCDHPQYLLALTTAPKGLIQPQLSSF